MRRMSGWVAAVLVTSLTGPANADDVTHVDMPAQSLAISLKELADQTGLQVAALASVVSDKAAPAVKGDFSVRDVLEKLLKNSGLAYKLVDARIVAVMPARAVDRGSLIEALATTAKVSPQRRATSRGIVS